jgi:hypothetical protein
VGVSNARAGLSRKLRKKNLICLKERFLRSIYGPSCVSGVWRIKYNDELYNLYKELSIVKMIKITMLKWLGHVARLEDNAPCKKITFSQPDSVLKDLKILTVTARDRDLWSKIIKEVKAHEGL